ncbi:tyrosinase family oxidase copper chaperone [Streptomyces sp. NRRL F-5126]|uniref:tyrosinase family oxidase copper chaperone n=1 Tax=Streptomyces sp. NRRL F-5126 TaxID=1463857 RepID=UPI0004C67F55|nr:tyrosinase family oxidase copper chaperone [Streptomyces sp. NRRL F-5126]
MTGATTGAAAGGGRTRRALLRTLYGLGALGGTAAALAPLVHADGAARTGTVDPPAPGAPPYRQAVEETYRGRHISIRPSTGVATTGTAAYRPGVHPDVPADDVLVDGRPLKLMRRADGGWMSVVNHYESFPTPLAAARAAVDDLHGARLSLDGPMLHHA